MSKKPSDFSFGEYSFEAFEFEDQSEESLQRTKEWLIKRGDRE